MNLQEFRPRRRTVLLSALGAALCAPRAWAQAYPSRPIRLIVPNAPASSVDTFARQITPAMVASLGQAIVIDNITGSGGLIGINQLLRSPRDGYTIGMVASNFAIAPSLYKLPYDSLKDITPVSILVTGPMVLVIHPSIRADNVREFVALAKQRSADKSMTYGSAGIGTTAHLAGELMAVKSGADFLHVPYKGNNTFTTDLISGQLDAGFLATGVAAPYIRAGKLKALGVSTAMRASMLPQVPTLAEAGLNGFDLGGWQALIATAGTPPEVINRLNAEVVRVLGLAEVRRYIDEAGSQVVASSVPDARKWFEREFDNYAKLADAIGLKPA